jgi:hypothetical protein
MALILLILKPSSSSRGNNFSNWRNASISWSRSAMNERRWCSNSGRRPEGQRVWGEMAPHDRLIFAISARSATPPRKWNMFAPAPQEQNAMTAATRPSCRWNSWRPRQRIRPQTYLESTSRRVSHETNSSSRNGGSVRGAQHPRD